MGFTNREKANLDIFWLRDETLEESDNLPDPDVLIQEIVEDLEAREKRGREGTGRSGVLFRPDGGSNEGAGDEVTE